MIERIVWPALVLAVTAVVACERGSDEAGDVDDGMSAGGGGSGGAVGEGGSGGGGSGGRADIGCDEKAAMCASEFGALFTNSNGRADGTLLAVVRPTDTQCTLFNDDHVVVQLLIDGQAQRLVVAVDDVATASVEAPLVGPAYAEGWHEDVTLDYPGDLGLAPTDLTSVSLDQAVDFICSAMTLGAPVSIYAYSDGTQPSSAHQIHRNDNYPDGAIVVDPTGPAPTYLVFRYNNQTW